MKLRPHTLRKFFRTYHGASVEVKEMLMGHRGYLTDQYVRYSIDDLRVAYNKGMSGVQIFSDFGFSEIAKADLEAARRERDTLNKKLGILEKELMSKFSLTEEEIMNIYYETLGVSRAHICSYAPVSRGVKTVTDGLAVT